MEALAAAPMMLTFAFVAFVAVVAFLLPTFVLRIRREIIDLRIDVRSMLHEMEAMNEHLELLVKVAHKGEMPADPSQKK